MPITLDDLRRFAVARSLFTPTTLKRALHRLGFVQADPIRAPARAQDLTLRHRVKDRSLHTGAQTQARVLRSTAAVARPRDWLGQPLSEERRARVRARLRRVASTARSRVQARSEEHTSELQSLAYLVCRLLLEKKKRDATRAA